MHTLVYFKCTVVRCEVERSIRRFIDRRFVAPFCTQARKGQIKRQRNSLAQSGQIGLTHGFLPPLRYIHSEDYQCGFTH